MLSKKEIKSWTSGKNRMGFKNFIKDHDKIQEKYEEILDNSEYFIDHLDHFMIATTIELGIKKELKIKKLKKKIRKLEEALYENG
jgi:hypothetical protein